MPDSDKGFPLPDPVDGYPLICVCLKIPDVAQYRQDFLGHIWQLGKWWNWEQSGLPGDTRAKEAAQYWRDLLAEHLKMGCCCTNPPAPSFTDYINSASYVTSTTTTYNTTYNTWNTAGQTVASIAPNLDYSSGVPADIDKLMCLAYSLLLQTIVATAKNVQLGTEDQAKDLTRQLTAVFGGLAAAGGAATLAGGAAAAVVAFFGGPAVVLGLALAAVGTAIATLVYPTETAVFDDTEAIENVYCTMVTNAVGVTPTRDIFQGALNPNGFAPDSHEAQLAAIIQPYLDDLNTYLQFIQLMSQLYDALDLGLLPDCSCTEPPDPECVDLKTTPEQWTFPTGFGSWIDGEGLAPVNSGGTPLFYASRTQNAAGTVYCNRFTISFSAPTSAIIVFNAHDSWHYSGAAITTLDVNPTSAPTMFPGGHFNIGSTGSQIGVTFESGSVAPSLAWRMIESCIYLEP